MRGQMGVRLEMGRQTGQRALPGRGIARRHGPVGLWSADRGGDAACRQEEVRQRKKGCFLDPALKTRCFKPEEATQRRKSWRRAWACPCVVLCTPTEANDRGRGDERKRSECRARSQGPTAGGRTDPKWRMRWGGNEGERDAIIKRRECWWMWYAVAADKQLLRRTTSCVLTFFSLRSFYPGRGAGH